MKIENGKSAWALIILPAIMLLAIIMITNAMIGLGEVSNFSKRFANAFLTSYTLTAGVFFGAMFFYADSRNRPLSPLFGMLTATLIGAVMLFLFLSQGELLMENNGSMQAQFFSNIVHLAVVFTAIMTASGLLIGIAMSHITGNSSSELVWPTTSEEE